MADGSAPLNVQQFDWIVVVMLQTYAASQTLRVAREFRRQWPGLPTHLKAGIGYLAADLGMLNFLAVDTVNLFRGELISGTGCSASSVVAITAICFLTLACGVMAWATHCMVSSRRVTDAQLFARLALALLVSVATAVGYELTGNTGPYRGLYCCVGDGNLSWSTLAPIVAFTSVSVAVMAKEYGAAFRVARVVASSASVAVIPQSPRADGTARPPVRADTALLWHGLRMIGAFYGCWALIVVSAVYTVVSGHQFPVEIDMIAAWLAKVQPIINASLLGTALRRRARALKSGGGGGSGPSSRPVSGRHRQVISEHAFTTLQRKVTTLEAQVRSLTSSASAESAPPSRTASGRSATGPGGEGSAVTGPGTARLPPM